MPPRRASARHAAQPKSAAALPSSPTTPVQSRKSTRRGKPAIAADEPAVGRTAAREVWQTLDIRHMILTLLDRRTLFGMMALEKNGVSSIADIVYKSINIANLKKFTRKNVGTRPLFYSSRSECWWNSHDPLCTAERSRSSRYAHFPKSAARLSSSRSLLPLSYSIPKGCSATSTAGKASSHDSTLSSTNSLLANWMMLMSSDCATGTSRSTFTPQSTSQSTACSSPKRPGPPCLLYRLTTV